MVRLIDAYALINELNNSHYPGAPYIDAGISIAIGKVCDAPTIEPERKTGQWIPVTERLPEGGGFYIVTENVSEDGDKWVGLRWYSTVHGWEFDPVAWMPLPEPYQEEGE